MDELEGQIKAARSPLNDLEQRRLWADLSQRIVGETPGRVTVDRFVVLGRVGAGGVGAVYAAFDPELDRKIAIKLLHPSRQGHPGDRERFLREARSMARIAHPNVATVFQVGTFEDQPFLTMELIEGQSLAAWLRDEPHRWDEVLERFVSAGRGLAAAHATGLIHGDFKPENVLLSTDARVLVTDFGLARLVEQADADSAVMGTPSYMAPEQHAGTGADPRSDQFAFCVSLYEGLYGTRPFQGSLESMEEQKAAGLNEDPPGERTVPPWLHAVVLRGLAPSPGQRWPSMDAVLERLTRRSRWASLGWFAAAASTIAIVLGAITATGDDERCGGAEQAIDGVWDPRTKEAVRAALLGTRLAYANDTWLHVERSVDRFVSDWAERYTSACRAAEAGIAPAGAGLDLRLACEKRRLDDLRVLIAVWSEADATITQKAVHAVAALPADDSCNQLADRDEPEPEVEAFQARVSEANVLLLAGRPDRARSIVESLSREIAGLDDLQPSSDLLLLEGQMHIRRGDYEAATASLGRAAWHASSAGNDEAAVDAAIALVLALGVRNTRFHEAKLWARHGEAWIRRAALGRSTEAELHDAVGMMLAHAGEYEASIAHHQRALDIRREVLGPSDPAVSTSLSSLATAMRLAGRNEEARALDERALGNMVEAWGPRHPAVGSTLLNLAIVARHQGKLEESLSNSTRALSILEDAYGPTHPKLVTPSNSIAASLQMLGFSRRALSRYRSALTLQIRVRRVLHPGTAELLHNMGRTLRSLGRYPEARAHYQRALWILERTIGRDHPSFGASLHNLAYTYHEEGDGDRALELYERALAIQVSALGQGHARIARTLRNMGRLLAERHELERAVAYLERSFVLLDAPNVEPLELAESSFELAKVVVQSNPARARALATRAQTLFAEGRRERAEEVRSWLVSSSPG